MRRATFASSHCRKRSKSTRRSKALVCQGWLRLVISARLLLSESRPIIVGRRTASIRLGVLRGDFRRSGHISCPARTSVGQEHAAVAAWVDEASRTLSDSSFSSSPIDLKSTPAGKQLLEAPVEQLRKRVLAAFEQAHHWIELTDRSGWNPFGSAFKRYRLAVAVAGALMRRNLPFASADLQAILKWSCDAEGSHRLFLPVALSHPRLGAVRRRQLD